MARQYRLGRLSDQPIVSVSIKPRSLVPRYNCCWLTRVSTSATTGRIRAAGRFKSENGKTKGVLAPNEFWYFWRRFLAEPERDVWNDDELWQSMDTQTMLAELSGMMDVFQKPFAAKGMLFNYNIAFLNSVFDKALFVQIKRNIVTNVASVLEARKRRFGSEDAWYSFKISGA